MKQVDDYIAAQNEWQAKNLTAFRNVVHRVAPDSEEDFKWSCPVFTINKKLTCAMSVFTEHTKFNFFKGASINYDHVADLMKQAAAQVA